jgi:gliding motility-associated-like protein
VSPGGLCESNKIQVLAQVEDPKIEVFNVVTVNENGKHDFLKIVNIEQFPGNKVTIYNRWGDKVFEVSDYDNQNNVFAGLDDSGNELPDGNYFYVIDRNNGRKVKNGYLYLRR